MNIIHFLILVNLCSREVHPRYEFYERNFLCRQKLGGEEEFNDPVRVYDTSGAWGDESFHKDPHVVFLEVRLNWITERG